MTNRDEIEKKLAEPYAITLDDIEQEAWAAIDHHPITNSTLFAPQGFAPALVLGLVQRLRKAEEIVRDLAASPCCGTVGHETTNCVLCPDRGTDLKDINGDLHYAECPWRRAVEAGL